MLKWRPLPMRFTIPMARRDTFVAQIRLAETIDRRIQGRLSRAQTVSTTEDEDPDLRLLKSNELSLYLDF